MEEKLQIELPSVKEIQKLSLSLPVVSNQRTAMITPAPIVFSMDRNAHPSQHPPPVHPEPQRRKYNPITELIRTGFTAVSHTAVAPLERVKLLLQTQNEQMRSGRLSHPYRGIKDCLFRTIKHEGFLSLWRGNLTHIALLFQTLAVEHALVSCLSSYLSVQKDERGPRNASVGSIAIIYFIMSSGSLFTHPLDFGKTRLACDVKQANGSWQFTTLIDTYQKMLKSNGIAGLYRGYTLAFCGDLASLFIATSLKKTKSLKGDNERTAVYVHVPISITAQLVLYPVDTARRRMMMTTGEVARYAGVEDAFKQIVKREGLSSLYKGITASILRVSAASLLYHSVSDLFIKSAGSARPKGN